MIDSVDTKISISTGTGTVTGTLTRNNLCSVKKNKYRWRIYKFLRFLDSPSAGKTTEGESGTGAPALLSVKI